MNQHKRNVSNMHNAIRIKSEANTQFVLKLLDEMFQNKQPISFSAVATSANVSRAWLYQNEKLSKKIKNLRQEQNTVICHPHISAKDSVINSLKNKISKLQNENNELRKQLEIAYGELHLNKP